jgi:hypothetical protein
MSELHTAIGECVDAIARNVLTGMDRSNIAKKIDAYWKEVADDEGDEYDETQREICYELMDWWVDHPLN